jgi:protease I
MANKVLMVIAFIGYRDEEYHQPKEIIEKADIAVSTASTETGMARGKLGATARVDFSLDQVDVSDYDAIAFIGGPGSYDLFDNKQAQRIAQDAVKQGKVLAAICAATAILAQAGMLKGVKATCFPGVSDILKAKGAAYSPSGFEVAGKIITADGPAHAKQFGEAIVKALT